MRSLSFTAEDSHFLILYFSYFYKGSPVALKKYKWLNVVRCLVFVVKGKHCKLVQTKLWSSVCSLVFTDHPSVAVLCWDTQTFPCHTILIPYQKNVSSVSYTNNKIQITIVYDKWHQGSTWYKWQRNDLHSHGGFTGNNACHLMSFISAPLLWL